MGAEKVTAAKPRTAGVIYRAPLGTALPTDADTALAATYKSLGHLSEDGFTNNNSASSEVIRDMGGSPVLTVQTEKNDTFAFTLIDVLEEEVLKAVYGSTNVTGDLTAGLAVTANSDEPEEAVWVLDTIMRGGVLQRIVIPDGKISEISEIGYKRDEAVGYGVTVTALANDSGETHYTYYKEA